MGLCEVRNGLKMEFPVLGLERVGKTSVTFVHNLRQSMTPVGPHAQHSDPCAWAHLAPAGH